MTRCWCMEFHCKDCEAPEGRVEKIVVNLNEPEEVKELVLWLRVHNSQGGTYQSTYRYTHNALYDQMILDGWNISIDKKGGEWLEKGVVRINVEQLEVRRLPP